MSTADFLKKENVELLWEVLIDEGILKNYTSEIVGKILHIFNNNISGFYENERKKANNLIDLNKKYVLLILQFISKNFPLQKNPSNYTHNKIQIHEETKPIINAKEPITFEEIQKNKMSQFEKDLNLRQQEFTSAMSIPVPAKPDFNDNLNEGPIGELDEVIKKMTAQRNYDIEQINRNNLEANTNSNTNSNTNWLKPQETSVKNEKLNPLQQKPNIKPSLQLQQEQEQSKKIKYIKIDNDDLNNEIIQNDVIDINNDNNDNSKKITSPKKQVSWNNNIEYENNFEDDFFKKLKTIKPNESQMVSNNNSTNEINSIKEELKTFNVKIENLTQNVNAILELLKQSPSKLLV